MSIKFKLPDEKKREPARRRGVTKRYSINYTLIKRRAKKVKKQKKDLSKS